MIQSDDIYIVMTTFSMREDEVLSLPFRKFTDMLRYAQKHNPSTLLDIHLSRIEKLLGAEQMQSELMVTATKEMVEYEKQSILLRQLKEFK